jgi:hypothetical protein
MFALFRDVEPLDITGPDGQVADTLLLRSLSWDQNQVLIQRMEQSRVRIKASMSQSNDYDLIAEAAGRMHTPDLVRAVLDMERPLAEDSADLAPGATTDSKEETATQKWEKAREKELTEMTPEDLRGTFIRRQESLFIQARVVQEFINDTLCLMVLDPDTNQSMFSMDPQHEDFIGGIQPELRQQLILGRSKFLNSRGEKSVRKAAETGAFLSSGASPNPPADSPGATTETQPTSQPSP